MEVANVGFFITHKSSSLHYNKASTRRIINENSSDLDVATSSNDDEGGKRKSDSPNQWSQMEDEDEMEGDSDEDLDGIDASQLKNILQSEVCIVFDLLCYWYGFAL